MRTFITHQTWHEQTELENTKFLSLPLHLAKLVRFSKRMPGKQYWIDAVRYSVADILDRGYCPWAGVEFDRMRSVSCIQVVWFVLETYGSWCCQYQGSTGQVFQREVLSLRASTWVYGRYDSWSIHFESIDILCEVWWYSIAAHRFTAVLISCPIPYSFVWIVVSVYESLIDVANSNCWAILSFACLLFIGEQ